MKCTGTCCKAAASPTARWWRYARRADGQKLLLFVPVCLLALSCYFTTNVRAAVTAVGDVLPADDPFPPNDLTNEGLPPGGNFIDISLPIGGQTFFENNEVVAGYENIDAGVVVGQRSFGRLDIDGNSQLRYQTLVIGDRGTVGGQQRRGTGFMLITGLDALYNNDPNLLPAGLPTGFGSTNARSKEEGFDLYVGRYGQGTLEIRGGGRAEIQDSVLVGDQPGSTGNLTIDGLNSFLSSGGFETSGGVSEFHQLIVGRLGDGFMTISTGGTVVTEAIQQGGGDFDVIAAVIGGEPTPNDTQEPQAGGRGDVWVTGPGSKWVIGGSLQIGGFQDRGRGSMSDAVDGTGLEYSSTDGQAGRGTLRVAEGGLVTMHHAANADPDNDDLRLLIGRFGRVTLAGGDIRIGDPGTTMDTVQLVNDGVIAGSGRIYTGVFRNRYLGEIRVGPSEKLLVDSASEFRSDQDLPPLVNWGVIQVLGTRDQRAEIEFDRAPNAPSNPVQPFRNLRVARPTAAPPGDFYGGVISAQHAVLRFRSGLLNEGMLAFTEGTNYITGDVINLDAPMPQDRGIINVLGSGVKAVFENDLLNAGVLNIQGGAVVEVLARHSFVTAGELMIDLNPTNPTHLLVGGDAGITGDLTVSLTGFGTGSLSVGDTFEIISVAGDLGGVDLSDPLNPRPDLTINPLFTGINISPNLTSLGLPANAVMIPVYTADSVLLAIRSTAGIIGADFNGDGVVDLSDLAILQMNIGLTMGATPLQGDADGDGDVDGEDFLEWQRQLGPVPGSGTSIAAASANVPEPTSWLLCLAGLVWAAAGRRGVR